MNIPLSAVKSRLEAHIYPESRVFGLIIVLLTQTATNNILKTERSLILKTQIMDVIKEIIQHSAIGPYSKWSKGLVISLFSSIVFTLAYMLVSLLSSMPQNIQFGY